MEYWSQQRRKRKRLSLGKNNGHGLGIEGIKIQLSGRLKLVEQQVQRLCQSAVGRHKEGKPAEGGSLGIRKVHGRKLHNWPGEGKVGPPKGADHAGMCGRVRLWEEKRVRAAKSANSTSNQGAHTGTFVICLEKRVGAEPKTTRDSPRAKTINTKKKIKKIKNGDQKKNWTSLQGSIEGG